MDVTRRACGFGRLFRVGAFLFQHDRNGWASSPGHRPCSDGMGPPSSVRQRRISRRFMVSAGSISQNSDSPAARASSPKHVLTIDLEDYFQVEAFADVIDRTEWE